MGLINKILNVPILWNISQFIFGCDPQKKRLYRSVFEKTGRLLDFGCADGNVFAAFKDFEYYGIDTNSKLIEYAQKKYASFENAHFVNADILDRPFPEEFFDFVLFACAGHHIRDDLLFKITYELGEVLKAGGSLHFFDTIKDPRRRSPLLKFLIGLDQGKFMRDEERYHAIVDKFSERLKPITTKTLKIEGTFMPQPTYFYAEFGKV